MRHRNTCENYAKRIMKFVWQFPTAKMTNNLTKQSLDKNTR